MAKRTRKQKQRAAVRRPAPSVAAPAPVPAAGLSVEAGAAGVVPGVSPAAASVEVAAADPTRRRVERLSGLVPAPRARPPRSQQAGYIQPLDSEDAAIPFDRVPYVPADLRRVALIAGLMIALIVIADIIVSNVVK